MKDWRYHVAIPSTAMTDNDTDQFDLPSEGVLSKLELYLYNRNNNAHQNSIYRRLSEHITNIEIRGDTNDVIYDENCQQGRAWAVDTELRVPPEKFHGYGAKGQWTCLPIYFGRYARDEKYGLDLSKWTNVRISITNDFTATYFQAAEATLTVRALWTFDESIKPTHYLAKTIIDEQSVPQAGTWARPVILPDRFPIRRIAVEGGVDVEGVGDNCPGKPRTSASNCIRDMIFYKMGRRDVIWHDRLSNLWRFNEDEYGHHLTEEFQDGGGSNMYMDSMLGYPETLTSAIQGDTAAAASESACFADDQERVIQVRAWPEIDWAAVAAYGNGYNQTGFFRFYSMKPYELSTDVVDQWLQPGAKGEKVCELLYYLNLATYCHARTHVEQAIPHPTD